MTVMQRSRRSWTRWRLRQTSRKTRRAQRRLLLLQLQTDSQLLLVKELLQQQAQLRHRQLEMQESRLWHQEHLPQLPPPETLHPPHPSPDLEELRQLLQLET